MKSVIGGTARDVPERDSAPDTVDLWVITLDRQFQASESRYVDEGERERAARMTGQQRRHFTATRTGARVILARYTQLPPTDLPWRIGPWGKPYLDGHGMPTFNVSHCGSMAAVAVLGTGHRDVGVDLERVTEDGRHQLVVERWFRPAERQAVRHVGLSAAAHEATRLWTRKEACAKVTGERLLDMLHLPVTGSPPVIRTGPSPSAGPDRCVRDVEVQPDWMAAVALTGTDDFQIRVLNGSADDTQDDGRT
ncbi:4'-phosphopantetheinyl transferase superfamily protein [Actinoplanes sp. NPDC051475]|uniref:4'-phosphopantetheinyl transferase family protein n=1 Tax=Actinoplanes sp. NPDC051475 TaxID=3157225 RepID=UPI00344DEA85